MPDSPPSQEDFTQTESANSVAFTKSLGATECTIGHQAASDIPPFVEVGKHTAVTVFTITAQ